jgi:rhodanese-related sulfurtransferase
MSTLQIGVLVAIVLLWLVLPRLGKTSSTEARKLVEAGARLIDVRSPGEFGGGHLPGAINIPVDQIASRVAELKKSDKPIVLYCASGMRSGQAKRILAGAGIAGLHDLGAMSRW